MTRGVQHMKAPATSVSFCGYQEDKQYLNLSEYAYQIIRSDMLSFNCEKIGTFVNQIFHNYYPDAEATISQTLKKKRDEWTAMLSDLADCESAVECLLEAEKNRLLEKVNSYPKEQTLKFRLNNENYEYLAPDKCEDPFATVTATCPEAEYYPRSSIYMKAVLEEYARKTYYEREGIYYRDIITEIQNALSRDMELRVTIQNGARFYVRPHSIAPDKQCIYHYLVGLSYPVTGKPSDAGIFSFRLSRIQKISLHDTVNRSGFIKKATKAEISRLIQEKGAPFVGGSTNTIQVQLTQQGERMYNTILHLRPSYLSREENGPHTIYTFECTPQQIEMYFLRFGPDAKILSPEFLAQRFRDFYYSAWQASSPESP